MAFGRQFVDSGFVAAQSEAFVKTALILPLKFADSPVLGVAVDLIGLIAFPIVQAVVTGPGTEEINPIDPTDSNMGIKGFQEQIDIQKIKWGVTFMVAYAVLSLYLMSPAVKKYVFQARGERGVY